MLDLKKSNNFAGTHLITHILDTSFQEMVDYFGKPHEVGSMDGKSQVQWTFELEDGSVMTIYDYKDTQPINKVTKWHIGGNNGMVIREYLETVGFETKDRLYDY